MMSQTIKNVRLKNGNRKDVNNPVKKLVKLTKNDDKCCIKLCPYNRGLENISRNNKVNDRGQCPPIFKLQENSEVVIEWIKRICSSSWGQTFDPGVDEVCVEHFTDDSIQKGDTFVLNGRKYSVPRSRLTWSLRPSAVPTIFEQTNIPPGPSSEFLLISGSTLVGDPVASTWYWCQTCRKFLPEIILKDHFQISVSDRNQLVMGHQTDPKTSNYTGHRILKLCSASTVRVSRLSDSQIAYNSSRTPKRSLRTKPKKTYFEGSDPEEEVKSGTQAPRIRKGKISKRKVIDDDFDLCTSSDDEKVTKAPSQRPVTTSRSKSGIPTLFFCLVCVSHAFRNQTVLALHMKANHLDKTTKTFKCPHCPNSRLKTATIKRFNDHMRRTHMNGPSGYRPSSMSQVISGREIYKCNQPGCRYVCRLKSKVQLHKEMHEKGLIESTKFKRDRNTDGIARPYVCTVCNLSFAKRDILKAHAIKNHVEKCPFTCKFCNATFGTNYGVTRHEMLHVNRPAIPCPKCDATFSNPSFLPRHMRRAHSKAAKSMNLKFVIRKQRFRVKPIVKKEISQQDSLGDSHTISNSKPTIQKSSCSSSTTRPVEKLPLEQTPVFEIIPKHENKEGHTQEQVVGENELSKSNVSPTDKQQLGLGLRVEAPEVRAEIEKLIGGPIRNQYRVSQVKHKCHICSLTFCRAYPLQAHLQKIHGIHDPWNKDKKDKDPSKDQDQDVPGQISTLCGVCGFSAKDPKTLKAHVKSHFSEGKNFPCRICGYRFASEGRLRAHIQRIHETPRAHPCKSCGRSFVTAEHLKIHMRQVHTSKYKGTFKCSDCDKMYQTMAGFKQHVKTIHSEFAKTFRCQICSEILSCRPSLQRHIRRVHVNRGIKMEKVTEESSKAEELFL